MVTDPTMETIDPYTVPCPICCAPVTEPCQNMCGSERAAPRWTRMYVAAKEATMAGAL